jgi:small-conductance mechanosensitive channel
MTDTLALLGGGAVLALLLALILTLRLRSFWVRQLTVPLAIAAGWATLEVYRLLAPQAAPRLESADSWLLLFLGLATLLRLFSIFLFDVHLAARRGVSLPPLLPAVTMGAVYGLTALVTLKLAFPKADVSPVLATSAVTSLVLGLALQPILGNFFAGLVISLEKPFRLNDWIRVGEQEGRVVAITWRTTHLRTRDNDNLVLPNAKLADERVLNYYYPQPTHLEHIRVPAGHVHPPHLVQRTLLAAAAAVPRVLEKPSPEVYLLSFDESSITYELRIWIDDMAEAHRIASEVRGRIWEAFRKEGITMPFPHRTIEIGRRPARRDAERAGEARPAARLVVLEGPDRGRSLALGAGGAVIGRAAECALALSDPNASKEHLRIDREKEGFVATDLDSRFGTRVNGRPASGPTPIAFFDRIAVGDSVLLLEPEG